MTAAFLEDYELEGVRVCGVPDHLGQGDNCRWPDGDIRWAVQRLIPGVTLEQFETTLASVYAHLAEHCGITPRKVEQVRDARIASGSEKIDGPSNVLAWSELPCGNKQQCLQAYDSSEQWSVAKQDGKIWLWMVVLHEVMHALGVPHAPAGVTAVIAPTYNPKLAGLQSYDIQQLQKRYGPPKAAPTTPTTPTNPTTPNGGSAMANLLKTLLLNAAKSWLDSAIKDGTLQRWLEEILTKLTSQQIVNSEQLVEHVTEKLTAS